jgi:hypothetical protein
MDTLTQQKIFIGSSQDVPRFIEENYKHYMPIPYKVTSDNLTEVLEKLGITFKDTILSVHEREFIFYKK